MKCQNLFPGKNKNISKCCRLKFLPQVLRFNFCCRYYVNARTATVDQFIDPDVLNILIQEVITGYSIKNQTAKHAQLWLGETSSAWGGGAEGLSDRYVAGFM